MSSAVIFDHTAVAALGSGNKTLSGMVVAAHQSNRYHIYVPAMCLTAAEVERRGTVEHMGAMAAIRVVDLGYADTSAVAAAIVNGGNWRTAHAVAAAAPTLEWPAGRPVVTCEPERYEGLKIRVITVR
jgi:hypothetical protein